MVLSSYLALARRRLDVMRQLADALARGQAALATSDPQQILLHAQSQQQLCRLWQELESSIRAQLGNRDAIFARPLNLEVQPEGWNELQVEFAIVEGRVRHLQRVHSALLRRMRRTIAILGHLLESSQLTYNAPGAERAVAVRE